MTDPKESEYSLSYSPTTISLWVHTYHDHGIVPTENAINITDKTIHEKVLSELQKKLRNNMPPAEAENIFKNIASDNGLEIKKTVKDTL